MPYKDKGVAKTKAHDYYLKNRDTKISYAKKSYVDNRALRLQQVKANWFSKTFEERQSVHLKKRYGITLDQKKELIRQQGHECGMPDCVRHVDTSSPLDHDHKTGKARSVLCQKCNIQVWIFEARRVAFETYVA